MRKIIDLTHPLSDGLEGFPGNETVRVNPLLQIADGGYRVSTLFTDTHTGTHLDMPCHVFPDGKGLECLDLDKCIGKAFRVSLVKEPGDEITRQELEPFAEEICRTKRLIIATGWSERFGKPEFYQDFPGVTLDAASWLVELGVVLLGIEQPSVNPSLHLEVHHKLLENGVVIIEALAWPDRIPADEFEITCLPLPISGGDGSPVRVVAVVD